MEDSRRGQSQGMQDVLCDRVRSRSKFQTRMQESHGTGGKALLTEHQRLGFTWSGKTFRDSGYHRTMKSRPVDIVSFCDSGKVELLCENYSRTQGIYVWGPMAISLLRGATTMVHDQWGYYYWKGRITLLLKVYLFCRDFLFCTRPWGLVLSTMLWSMDGTIDYVEIRVGWCRQMALQTLGGLRHRARNGPSFWRPWGHRYAFA